MAHYSKIILSGLSVLFLFGCSSSNSSKKDNISSVSSNSLITTSSSSYNSSSTFHSTVTTRSSSSSDIDEIDINSIYLNYNETIKYEYLLGETLDLSNVSITVIYENGEEEIINVTSDMITITNYDNKETSLNNAGYMYVNITYSSLTTSYLIEVIDVNAPVAKQDALVSFNYDAGATFYLNGEERPSITVLPSNLEYTITYSSDTTGYNSSEFPSVAGTYSLVAKFEGNNEYNPFTVWRWFKLVGDKSTPEITFNYTGGDTFYIGDSKIPTVTISEGANYKITYSSDTSGYNSSEFPSVAGTYSLVVEVIEDDVYLGTKKWLWFRLAEPVNNEKQTATITFNYENGGSFSLSDDLRPSVTITEGANYKITYSSDTTGYNSSEFPSVAGTYSLVVEVIEDDKFNYSFVYKWFILTE